MSARFIHSVIHTSSQRGELNASLPVGPMQKVPGTNVY